MKISNEQKKKRQRKKVGKGKEGKWKLKDWTTGVNTDDFFRYLVIRTKTDFQALT